MFAKWMVMNRQSRFENFTSLMLALTVSLILFSSVTPASAQDQPQAQPQTQPQDNTQNNGKPKQEAPPEAGGPTDSVGPYSIPRKNPDEAPPPPPPPVAPKAEGLPDYSIKVNVPLVNVDVMVTTKSGQFVPGLKKENFVLFEDGAQQQITSFNQSKAPITAVLLVEFASTNYVFMRDALMASYAFANTLTKDDWVAVSYYDMQPHILVDFTQDKKAIYGALNQLRVPGFSETNLFDALYDTLDRLDRVEGKKYVILVTTGVDTFSKLTLDKITKKIKDTKDVTIFPISVGQILRIMYPNARRGPGIPHSEMDYLQADNEMRAFATMTGGRAYFPRFAAEYGEDFQDIGNDIRNQYSLSYHPTNSKLDGTYRKLKVEVLTPEGAPLKVKDQKGKDQKIDVVARDGYTAKHTVD
ncbi:MAG TPA: VWA domain-containing protein [Candidatus Sulfotelmatobacter sp.]|jgi:VWFA-related protein|nr:VWA domain-containing protein [Candidatus Sulfotelmatobacter sp.]